MADILLGRLYRLEAADLEAALSTDYIGLAQAYVLAEGDARGWKSCLTFFSVARPPTPLG